MTTTTDPDVLQIDIKQLVQDTIERSISYLNQNEFRAAEELLRQVAKISEDTNQSNHLLALALHRQGKNKDALRIMRAICKVDPLWEYLNTLGVIYSSMHERTLAIATFKRAIRIDKNAVMAYSNLALEHQSLGNCDEAEKILRHAIMQTDEPSMLYFNLGNVLLENQMPKTAAVCFEKTKQALPDFHAARWNRAAALLINGQYEEGWKEYESRFDIFPNFTNIRNSYNSPQWKGESLEGKTILLFAEQGAGDAIQFARFTKQLKERGAKRVLVDCPNVPDRGNFRTLLKGIKWIDITIDTTAAQWGHDYHQSLMSLPFILNLNSADDIKCDPYIDVPDFADFNKHTFLGLPEGEFKIGICWAGSPIHHKDHLRSCKVIDFIDFFDIPNVQVFSLQADCRKRVWRGCNNEIDLSEGLDHLPIIKTFLGKDYANTAKVIDRMDLVVTVDTAVAHLAGAMGKRTIVLLPYLPDWRWSLNTDKTPWYDSVTLCRQRRQSDWGSAIERAVELVKRWARPSNGEKWLLHNLSVGL